MRVQALVLLMLSSLVFAGPHDRSRSHRSTPAPETPVNYAMDLRGHLVTPLDIQVGPTCHIYALTTLAEEACFRRTGKVLKLSAGTMLAQHLRLQMAGGMPASETQTVVVETKTSFEQHTTRMVTNPSALKAIDGGGKPVGFIGGSPGFNAKHLLGPGTLLAADEFVLTDAWLGKLRSNVGSPGAKIEAEEFRGYKKGDKHERVEGEAAVRARARARLVGALDTLVQGSIAGASPGAPLYRVASANSTLNECMSKGPLRPDIKENVQGALKGLSSEDIVAHSQNRRAVLCENAEHSVVVLSYESNGQGGAKEFVVRDPNYSTLSRVPSLNCLRLVALD